MQRNWFGREPQPTDDYIGAYGGFQKAYTRSEVLRHLFDSIPEDYHNVVLALMEEAKDYGQSDQ